MLRSETNLLVLLSILLVATLTAPAAFVSYSGPGTIDTTIFPSLVDFNSIPPDASFPDFGTQVTSTAPVEVFNDGTFSVNFSVPNFSDFAGQVRYGNRTHAGQTTGAASPFISSDSGSPDVNHPSLGNIQQQLNFEIGGGLVSAIGIQISTIDSQVSVLTNITLEIFGVGNTLLDTFVIDPTSTPTLSSLQQANNNPELSGFVGFSRTENDIVALRITGGPIALDNLRFGTADSGDPGDPAAIPEASTFLLCGMGMTLLALWRRRKSA